MPTFDGVKPKRDYQALQFVWKKRYADRWQALGSFVYSTSTGIGRRSFRQDFNVEGPMFYDDNWMGTLNYTINNLTGLLPFTPQYEFKLSGSYTIPKIDVDVGGRFRTHSGRPFWHRKATRRSRRTAGRRTASLILADSRRSLPSIQEPRVLTKADAARSPSREALQVRQGAVGPVHRGRIQHLQQLHTDRCGSAQRVRRR
jgi:hypothetical protein